MQAYIYDLSVAGGPNPHMAWTEKAAKPTAERLKVGEILVQVHACALNPVDFKKPALMPLASLFLGGSVVAQDYSGVVLASRSPSFAPGDCVFGTNEGGCCAQLLATPAATAHAKPAALSHAQAASLVTASQTALQALGGGGHAAPLARGGRALVVGASGGCGLAGLQIARAQVGAEGAVVGVCSADSFPLVQALGAASALADYAGGAEALLAALRPHAPFDLIYDTGSSREAADALPGGTPYAAALAPLLRPGTGCLVAINGSVAQWAGALTGWQRPQYRLLMQQPTGEDMRRTAELAAAGALRPVLDSVHAFSAAGCEAAYARLRSRRAKGKVVVQVVAEEQ